MANMLQIGGVLAQTPVNGDQYNTVLYVAVGALTLSVLVFIISIITIIMTRYEINHIQHPGAAGHHHQHEDGDEEGENLLYAAPNTTGAPIRYRTT